VLDGAHNDASAEAFAHTLTAYVGDRPVTLVVGMHADKEVEAVLRPLGSIASRAVATRSQSPRALPADDVAAFCRQLGMTTVVDTSVAGAIARARDLSSDVAVIAVTGSLAVVGEARDALGLPIVERLW
jgi:dihydrofolate synthase/folylpolyglutamate synthase